MPRATTKAPDTDDEVARLRAREARLRTRVDELEAELSRRGTRSQSRSRDMGDIADNIADTTRDNSLRAMDEASKLVRGLALSSLEAIRATTDAVDSFVSEVYDRNRPDSGDSIGDLARQLPGDIVAGFMEGVNRAFEVPNRAVDTLYSSYREGESRRTGRRRAAAGSSDDESDRIKRALGRPVTRVILDSQDNVILNTGEVITNQAVRRARSAGVLDILLDSVYEGDAPISAEDLRAPESGIAALEEGKS
jgi:hypothetical protein